VLTAQYRHPDKARCTRTLGLEFPGPEVGDKVAEPTGLISPTLGCVLARASVGPAVFVLAEFQLAFLNVTKLNRLHSFSSTPSDWREASVSLANATGV